MSSWRRWLCSLIVAGSLTIMAVDLGILLANRHVDNRTSFYSLSGPWSDYAQLRQEWRPRLLSNFLAGRLAQRVEGPIPESRMARVAAAWTGVWFFATALAIIAFTGRHAMFYLFATFAGVAFGYLPTVNARIYPWDLPALFIFTLFTVLVRGNRLAPLLILPAIGVLFKETSIVLCFALLCLEGSWRQRLGRFGLAAGLCIVVKLVIDAAVGVPLPGASMTTGDAQQSNLLFNLHALGHVAHRFMVHPIMVNAGTVAALFILPRKDSRIVMAQVTALLFALNMLAFGRIVEYRIWFELIPLAALAFELTLLEEPKRVAADQRGAEPPVFRYSWAPMSQRPSLLGLPSKSSAGHGSSEVPTPASTWGAETDAAR